MDITQIDIIELTIRELKRGTITSDEAKEQIMRTLNENSSGSLHPVIESQALWFNKNNSFWVTCGYDGDVEMHQRKPKRGQDLEMNEFFWHSNAYQKLNPDLFPNLKWEDKPIKVKLVEVKD